MNLMLNNSRVGVVIDPGERSLFHRNEWMGTNDLKKVWSRPALKCGTIFINLKRHDLY